MRSTISFILNDRLETVEFGNHSGLFPTTTLLQYLRQLPAHKGTKEGCAEGDCGACTVVIAEVTPAGVLHYRAIDSCLVFLPMVHRRQVITVEHLADPDGKLHPVQQAMVDLHGSQCGFCTPGVVMSLFALYKNNRNPSPEFIEEALVGNLCRCTGYASIAGAARLACQEDATDRFSVFEQEIIRRLSAISREPFLVDREQSRYFKPVTLTHALAFLAQHRDTIIISGATDTALRVTKRHENLRTILDLSEIDELKVIRESSTHLHLGAGAVITDILRFLTHHHAALASILRVFGSLQIRNIATLGGNLGAASPIGDALPVLMAYRAEVVLRSIGGTRTIPVDEFITGYRKTLRTPDELITAIIIPLRRTNEYTRSYKISKRKDLDISTVCGGFRIELDEAGMVKDIVLAFGGMADRTRRALAAEQYLLGKPWSRESVVQAQRIVRGEFTPISDVRGSAEFRSIAAGNLLMKFWLETKTDRRQA